MKRLIQIALVATPVLLVGCGSSFPPPTQPMADVEAADRSATELGASAVPEASLHLKLAEEQRNKAAALMKDGDNERATALLKRAKADAELALSLTHEQRAKAEVATATEKVQTNNAAANSGSPTPGGAK